MSLGYRLGSGMPFGEYTIAFTSVSNPQKSDYFMAIPDNTFADHKDTIRTDTAVVDIYAIELDPGDYVINDYKAYTDNGMLSRRFKSKEATPIRFTVSAGEIIYLGSFQLLQPNSMAPYYAVTDELARDVERFRLLRPNLKAIAVRKSIGNQQH